MNSNNPIRNYKHDITGKFKDISTAISSMDEKSFDDPDNNEIFHAVHEVLLKMVKTSRNTMAQNLKQEIVLVVSEQEPDLGLSKLQIEGVTVRYNNSLNEMQYHYFTGENEGDHKANVKIAKSMLPIKNVQWLNDGSKYEK